jgi:hypothetical protein
LSYRHVIEFFCSQVTFVDDLLGTLALDTHHDGVEAGNGDALRHLETIRCIELLANLAELTDLVRYVCAMHLSSLTS